MLKIATWNVNSIRVRFEHLAAWLTKEKPDVISLQETKVIDKDFPEKEILDLGYKVQFKGEPSYNGVALLSKTNMHDIVTNIPDLDDKQCRVLGATLENGIRVFSLYVPNGSTTTSLKYEYKLRWLDRLIDFLKEQIKKYPKIVLTGDFNIAPQDIDVYDPEKWSGKVLVSKPERERFQKILSLGFKDVVREHNSGKIYSWWDYRAFAFRRNLGLRIDHILASKSIKCTNAYIDKELRKLERPSDHTIVLAEINE